MPLSLWLPPTLAWLVAGALALALLAVSPEPAPAWGWIAAALPVALTLPFMVLHRPASFTLAMLGSVGYAGFALMESIANPTIRGWATALAAASLLALFLLLPAVRATRR
ncbi:MAG: hypothetical protein P8172_04200 [Gammaproteobacteria bacterium]|jgi:hypothetical protein